MASDLQTISEGIEAAAKQRHIIKDAWREQIGNPIVFVPDPDSERGQGIGYFQSVNGAFSARRYSNGYSSILWSIIH